MQIPAAVGPRSQPAARTSFGAGTSRPDRGRGAGRPCRTGRAWSRIPSAPSGSGNGNTIKVDTILRGDL